MLFANRVRCSRNSLRADTGSKSKEPGDDLIDQGAGRVLIAKRDLQPNQFMRDRRKFRRVSRNRLRLTHQPGDIRRSLHRFD